MIKLEHVEIAAIITSVLMVTLFIWVRAEVIYWQYQRIYKALYWYNRIALDNGIPNQTWFDDVVPFNTFMWRFWDFDCKHILPKEKFELVKPYLDFEENEDD